MRRTTTTIYHPRRIHARRRASAAALATGFGAAALLGLAAAPASAAAAAIGVAESGSATPRAIPGPATTTVPGTLLQGGATDAGSSTLFAYAAAGDSVELELVTTGDTPAGARVVVTDPTGAVVHDDAAPAAVAGTHLGGRWTAGVDGVWTATIVDPPSSTGEGASFAWHAGVVRDGASIPGRIWTESLAIHTPEPTEIALVAAAPDGARYRVTLDDYDGVDSTLRMNDVGNALAGTCEPVGRSVPMPGSPEGDGMGASYWQPSGADCEGLTAYRLFLDEPAADLPASTTAWADGRVDDTWLSSTYAPPAIASLAFARADATNAGTLTGELLGQPGVVRVEVDADGDGGFDGPTDVADEVAVLDPGTFAWSWDGLDAAGDAVAATTAGVAFRASMAQVAPVHFLRIDAETSVGGIEVEALAGPRPGVTTLHWDDTLLEPSSARRWSRTPNLIGSDPAATSAGGVHGWEAGGARPNQNDGVGGSWGDLRSIDDWAFVEDHAEATLALAPLADLRIDKRVDAEVLVADDGSAVGVRWTIEVANLGGGASAQTVVTDAYPAELDVASVVADPPSQGSFDAATGVWAVGDLAAGARATLTLQGTVSTPSGTAATVVNAASVTSAEWPSASGSCRSADAVESDDDRCDAVETPLEPIAVAEPPSPTPSEAAATEPAPTDAAATQPAPTSESRATTARGSRAETAALPRTGGDAAALTAMGATAVALLAGGAVLARRYRGRRS